MSDIKTGDELVLWSKSANARFHTVSDGDDVATMLSHGWRLATAEDREQDLAWLCMTHALRHVRELTPEERQYLFAALGRVVWGSFLRACVLNIEGRGGAR
jgi:hypothetical protein